MYIFYKGIKTMNEIPQVAGIYQIRNVINGKLYVGSSINLRKRSISHYNDLKNHRHNNSKLQRASDKYGLNNFIFEVLEIVDGKDKLLEKEQYYIDKLNVVEEGYNICPVAGNHLGFQFSEESIEKMRQSQKGNKNASGKRTEEQRKRMSEARKGKYCGVNSPNYGIKRTEEQRARLSEAHKGKKLSEEQKRKIGDSIRNKSPEEKARMYKNSGVKRAVTCVELNITFSSIKEACDFIGRDNRKYAGIYACCRGRSSTANGYHWVYADENKDS